MGGWGAFTIKFSDKRDDLVREQRGEIVAGFHRPRQDASGVHPEEHVIRGALQHSDYEGCPGTCRAELGQAGRTRAPAAGGIGHGAICPKAGFGVTPEPLTSLWDGGVESRHARKSGGGVRMVPQGLTVGLRPTAEGPHSRGSVLPVPTSFTRARVPSGGAGRGCGLNTAADARSRIGDRKVGIVCVDHGAAQVGCNSRAAVLSPGLAGIEPSPVNVGGGSLCLVACDHHGRIIARQEKHSEGTRAEIAVARLVSAKRNTFRSGHARAA